MGPCSRGSSLFSIPINLEHASQRVSFLAKVYRNSDGSYLGGFACEYAGNGSVEEAEANLREAMQQLFARRYQKRFYKLEIEKSVVRTYTPERSFGTILVGIGFASYLVPVLKSAVEVTPSHKDKSHVK